MLLFIGIINIIRFDGIVQESTKLSHYCYIFKSNLYKCFLKFILQVHICNNIIYNTENKGGYNVG